MNQTVGNGQLAPDTDKSPVHAEVEKEQHVLNVRGEEFKDATEKVTDGTYTYRAKLTFWPWGEEVQARLNLERIGEADDSYFYVDYWVAEILDATGHFFEASVERDVYNHSSECGDGDCPF